MLRESRGLAAQAAALIAGTNLAFGLVESVRPRSFVERVEVIVRPLARLWVAVFEPSDPAIESRQVEVRSGSGRLLRPSG
jgi:hypothetical protein